MACKVNHAKAQRFALGYGEIGNNAVSRGTFLRTGIQGAYDWKSFKADGSLQFDLANYHGSFLTGVQLRLGRRFAVKDFTFDLMAIGMFNRFSQVVQEYNWGVWAQKEHHHWLFGLGTHFRTFHLTSQDLPDAEPGDYSIHENWNVLYKIGYRIMPFDHPWNVTATLTNVDRFSLGQEMNPGLSLQGEWEFIQDWRAFMELRPVRSGAFNLSVSYFGYLMRAGIKWEFANN